MNVIKTIGKISELTNQTRDILGKGSKSKKIGYLKGRKFHWTTFVVAGGAVIGAITVIASFVFGVYSHLTMGAFLLITNSIALWRQKDYDLLAPLNTYMRELEELIGDMDEYIGKLKAFKATSKRERKGFSNTVDRYKKTADKHAKDLKDERREYKVLLSQAEKNQKLFEGQLKKAYQQCLKVQTNTDQMKDNVEKIANLSGAQSNKEFGRSVTQLDNENETLKSNVQEYKETNNELHDQIKELEDVLKEAQKFRKNQNFRHLKELQETVSGISEVREAFEMSLNDLDNSLVMSGESYHKSKKATKELGRGVEKLQEFNKSFAPVAQDLAVLVDELKKHNVKWDKAIKLLLNEMKKEGGKDRLKKVAGRVLSKNKGSKN